MIAPVQQIINRALDFCIPARCLLCYELITDPHGLCINCWQGIDFIADPHCFRCGAPFEFKVENEMICAPCLHQSPEFDQARSAVVYNSTSRHILLAFKHGDMLQAAKILSRWMIHAGKDLINTADVLMPVPLHPIRLFWRQYNQSAILTNEIHRFVQIPKCNNLLKRQKYTVSQGMKDFKDRRKNVKSVFKVSSKYLDYIKGKNVLIVDDVMTTGATVDECAKTLKKAGAKSVNVLTFARVVKPGGSF